MKKEQAILNPSNYIVKKGLKEKEVENFLGKISYTWSDSKYAMYSKILMKVATFCPRNTSHVREGRTEEAVGGSDGMLEGK